MYKRFEELLKDRNISAYKVSKATGVSQATFSQWKKGDYTPKADKLQKIADYFSVPISYFYEDQEPDDDEKRKLLLAFLALNDEGKAKLMEYANDLNDMEKYKNA